LCFQPLGLGISKHILEDGDRGAQPPKADAHLVHRFGVAPADPSSLNAKMAQTRKTDDLEGFGHRDILLELDRFTANREGPLVSVSA